MPWLLLLACAREPVPAASDGRPDVFLFTVDTLRLDHTSLGGASRPTTPWLAALAERGVVFETAIAPASWTVPSVATLLTGLEPHQHGLHGERPPPDWKIPPKPALPSRARTIAEHLDAAGYATYGFTSNVALAPSHGHARGFDVYANLPFGTAAEVQALVAPHAAAIRDAKEPVFVWVHLLDPHGPYRRQEPWFSAWDPGYDAWAAGREGRPIDAIIADDAQHDPDLQADGPGLGHLVALYDGEVRATDEALATLAKELGVGPEDFLVVTADHGEQFREHGRLGHRNGLWPEEVRVPLVVAGPGLAPARVATPVGLAAVAGTLAAAAGTPLPDAPTTLVDVARGHPAPRPIADVLAMGDGMPRLRSLWEGSLVLVTGPAGSHLYDVAADPGMQVDRAAERPEDVRRLEAALAERLAALTVVERDPLEPLDEAVLQQLRELGYLR